jgi:hypothetical protein
MRLRQIVVFSEATREAMNEPYRTLLGHYYWDKLIRNSHQYQYSKELFFMTL